MKRCELIKIKIQIISIKKLNHSSNYAKTIEISAEKEDIRLLINGLEYFINNVNSFMIAVFLDEDELAEYKNDCIEIKDELELFLK